MKILANQALVACIDNMKYFGQFDMLCFSFDKEGQMRFASSFKGRLEIASGTLFSNRFIHYMSLMPTNFVQFYSEKTNLFVKPVHLFKKHYVALIKKTSESVQIFIFFAKQRTDIVQLLLHKEVMKRMAIYIEENVPLQTTDIYVESMSAFYYNVSTVKHGSHLKQQLLEETLLVLLTKKEKQMVECYLQQHSIAAVVKTFNFSRSYVHQILLSSAHKLGLTRIQDLLTVSKTNNVLLYKGSEYGYRSN